VAFRALPLATTIAVTIHHDHQAVKEVRICTTDQILPA
jgi:hypothetical protein